MLDIRLVLVEVSPPRQTHTHTHIITYNHYVLWVTWKELCKCNEWFIVIIIVKWIWHLKYSHYWGYCKGNAVLTFHNLACNLILQEFTAWIICVSRDRADVCVKRGSADAIGHLIMDVNVDSQSNIASVHTGNCQLLPTIGHRYWQSIIAVGYHNG